AAHISAPACATATCSRQACSPQPLSLPTRRSSDLTKTDDTVSYDHLGQVITFTIVATNTGNVPQDITVSDTPALDGFSCNPTNRTTEQTGESLTCTRTDRVTQRDLNTGQFDDTACA